MTTSTDATMRYRFLLPAVGLWLLLLPMVQATPALQRAVFEDPGATLGIDEVVTQPFRPAGEVLSVGYSASAWWLRIELPPLAGEHWLLRVRPTFLDRISVFLPDGDGWREVDIGDRSSGRNRSLPSQFPNLHIPPAPVPRTLYLRVQSNSTLMVHADLLEVDDFRAAELLQWLLLACYFALMLLVTLWALVAVLIRGDRLLLAWLPYQLLSLLVAPALLGFPSLLWPDQPQRSDLLSTVIVLLLPPSALLFHHALWRSIGLPRWFLRCALGLMLASLPVLLLLASGELRVALAGNALLGALIALMSLLAVALMRGSPVLPLNTLRLIYLLHGLTLVWQMGFLLGWFRGVEANLYGTQLQGVFSALLVAVLLLLRERGQRRAQREALEQLRLSRERAAREQAQREASEALLAMLAHELRTPLSVVSLALARADGSQRSVQLGRAAVQDINGVVTRCLDVDRLESGSLRIEPRLLDLPEVVDEALAGLPVGRVRQELAATTLRADPGLLRSVLRNLLDNALKYSPPDSPVVLRSRIDGNGVAIDVENSVGAAGLPDPARVFQKYYRAPAAQSSTGAGLGTYLVKRLVEAQGGQAEWRATPGHASIRVWLPR